MIFSAIFILDKYTPNYDITDNYSINHQLPFYKTKGKISLNIKDFTF